MTPLAIDKVSLLEWVCWWINRNTVPAELQMDEQTETKRQHMAWQASLENQNSKQESGFNRVRW